MILATLLTLASWLGEPALSPPPPGRAPLKLQLAGRKDGQPLRFTVSSRVDQQLAADLELVDDPAGRRITGVALYLACRTPSHVPDRWRSQSLLGRERLGLPRHEMLLFVDLERAGADARDERTLALELPAALEVELATAVSHDLVLGIAVRLDDRYYPFREVRRQDVFVGEAGLALPIRVDRRGNLPPPGFQVVFADRRDEDKRRRKKGRPTSPVEPEERPRRRP